MKRITGTNNPLIRQAAMCFLWLFFMGYSSL
jgi:hypothetical protein